MINRVYPIQSLFKDPAKIPQVCYTRPMSASEDRLTAIEMKLAFLEDFMNKLQAVAVEQGAAIDRLKGESHAVLDKLSEIEDAVQDMPHVRPPHY